MCPDGTPLALSRGMHASRHWDEGTDGGFEGRVARHRRVYRRARARAARRNAFWDEFIRYCAITLLLIWIVRPIGILVAICWGLRLWRRYARLEVAPTLREHWTERELDRTPQRPRRRRAYATPDVPSEARELLERVGDDPDSSANLQLARAALADAGRATDTEATDTEDEAAVQAPRDEVNVADVLEQTLADLRERMERAGVGLSVEFDSAGRIRADAAQLRAAFADLLSSALASLETSTTRQPRLEVEMGENLARTQVWVRIRHNGRGPGSRESNEIILSKDGEERA